MIQVSIASGPRLTFPTATGWTFTEDEGMLIVYVLATKNSTGHKLAEIPVNNVLFVERIEEEETTEKVTPLAGVPVEGIFILPTSVLVTDPSDGKVYKLNITETTLQENKKTEPLEFPNLEGSP